jgi:hypothetical protein
VSWIAQALFGVVMASLVFAAYPMFLDAVPDRVQRR